MLLRTELVETIRNIHRRGWSEGTGGNYSVRLTEDPLTLLMSPSGIDKGTVREEDLLEVDANSQVLAGTGSPSAETLIHIAIMRSVGAASVLHTHSVWNTLLSFEKNEIVLEGYEMLKGLSKIRTHEHSEHIPILENSQDMASFSLKVDELLAEKPNIHGFLMKGHGLYTWGDSIFDAKRHVEVFEFLFEVEARRRSR